MKISTVHPRPRPPSPINGYGSTCFVRQKSPSIAEVANCYTPTSDKFLHKSQPNIRPFDEDDEDPVYSPHRSRAVSLGHRLSPPKSSVFRFPPPLEPVVNPKGNNQPDTLCSKCQGRISRASYVEEELPSTTLEETELPPYASAWRNSICQPAPLVGDITFVFTDVQSSTHLWNVATEAMRESLQLHNQVFRALIDIYEGYEVKTEGDAFMIAFTDISKAIRMCIDTQLKLLEVNWPPALLKQPHSNRVEIDNGGKVSDLLWNGLRVRIGLHIGPALAQRDPTTLRYDYFGPTVNRAARVSSIASGGEILISEAAHRSLCYCLPDDVTIISLGQHPMKGFDPSPEDTVYRVVPNELKNRTFSECRIPVSSSDDEIVDLNKISRVLAPWNEAAIVFVEMVGCVDLWGSIPDAMQSAWSIYHTTLHSTAKSCGLYHVRSEGSSFLAVSCNPVDATKLAIQLQCRLLSCNWPKDILTHTTTQPISGKVTTTLCNSQACMRGQYIWRGFRVRVGAHFGKVLATSDPVSGQLDYCGPAVVRTLAIKNSVPGGRSVISDLLYGLSKAGIGPHITIPLGTVELEGLYGFTSLIAIAPSCLEYRIFNAQLTGTVSPSPFTLSAIMDNNYFNSGNNEFTAVQKLMDLTSRFELERMRLEDMDASTSDEMVITKQRELVNKVISAMRHNLVEAKTRRNSEPKSLRRNHQIDEAFCMDDHIVVNSRSPVSTSSSILPKLNPPTTPVNGSQNTFMNQSPKNTNMTAALNRTIIRQKSRIDKLEVQLLAMKSKLEEEIRAHNSLKSEYTKVKEKCAQEHETSRTTDIQKPTSARRRRVSDGIPKAPTGTKPQLTSTRRPYSYSNGLTLHSTPDDAGYSSRRSSTNNSAYIAEDIEASAPTNTANQTCFYCNFNILTSQSIVEISGKIYHQQCFLCVQCEKVIDEEYVTVKGKNYHRQCATQAVGRLCCGCHQKFSTAGVSALGAIWHNECFRCATCSKVINLQQEEFYEHNGKAYHLECLPKTFSF